MNRLIDTLKKLPGVDDDIANVLIAAGYQTIKLINEASEVELKAIDGISASQAAQMKAYLNKVAHKP